VPKVQHLSVKHLAVVGHSRLAQISCHSATRVPDLPPALVRPPQGRVTHQRRYSLPWLNVTPFAAVQTATLWQRDFTETSTFNGLPGILGLTSQSRTTTSLPTFLGVQFDTRLALANSMVWSPFVRVAWVHEFRPDRSIAATFESVPGTLFAVDGARLE
jgi:hypothetical protein